MQKYIEIVKQYLEGIKRGDKRMSKNGMLILFLCGILLYVIYLPVENSGRYEMKDSDNTAVSTSVTMQMNEGTVSYQDKLEAELEDFLEMVEGVGAVEVLIYLDTSQEYVVEKDNPVKDSTGEDSAADGSKSVSSEKQIDEETVYTVNASGDEVPFVTQTKNPKIAGIVIAAQGADNEAVRLTIMKMAMALYGVEANKIDVLSMKK
ncbi:MAG: hypothetical protein E7290_11935 [Lachnospiraceae bacterium]|nr:hypothetical protein [Lachnospiraceae bacterium]